MARQALEIADRHPFLEPLDVVVIDSVAALVPKSELEGRNGRQQDGPCRQGCGARHCESLQPLFQKQILFASSSTNWEKKIGVMFGNPETTTGGKRLKFYSSVRLDIRRISQIKDGDEAVGNRVRVKVVKIRVAPPFQQQNLTLFSWRYIKTGEIIDMGVDMGIVQRWILV